MLCRIAVSDCRLEGQHKERHAAKPSSDVILTRRRTAKENSLSPARSLSLSLLADPELRSKSVNFARNRLPLQVEVVIAQPECADAAGAADRKSPVWPASWKVAAAAAAAARTQQVHCHSIICIVQTRCSPNC